MAQHSASIHNAIKVNMKMKRDERIVTALQDK